MNPGLRLPELKDPAPELHSPDRIAQAYHDIHTLRGVGYVLRKPAA